MKQDQKEYPTTIIPDPICACSKMKAEWLGIDCIGLHAFERPNTDVKSDYAPCEAKVHFLRSSSTLFDPIIRKLVNDSNGAFLAGQKLLPSPDVKADILRLSLKYRSIVLACIENLQEIGKKPGQEHYKEYVAIFFDIGFIWHLSEILFVNVVPGNVVLPQLLTWIRFYFPEAEHSATKILEGPLDLGAETRHSDYWSTLRMLIMQGQLEPARALLRLHTDADTNPFLTADTILRRLPTYNVYGGVSVLEFSTRWKSWQTNVINKIEEGLFSSCHELKVIMKIVSGEVVPEMKQSCQTWYQLMVATLLYNEPTVKSFDLSYHAIQNIKQFGGFENLKMLDNLIIAMFEFDLHKVINLLQQTCDSGWAAAHLASLLYQCNRLEVIDSKMFSGLSSNLDEELLLDYATLLMSHRSLWQVGVTYLDHCPTQGRTRLELLLPKIQLSTLARTQKVIQIAVERDMLHIACSICKIEGMKALKRHRIGQALNWALQSQDPGFVTHLADLLLKRYAKEGVFDSLDLLDNLGPCMFISDRLMCLAKYCEFQQFYQNGEFKKAAYLLTSLLTSKISPKYFWLTLLNDALPLLERQDEPVFSYKDTCELMSCLEELTTEETDHPRASMLPTVDRTKLIRLALTKNLKEALIYEGSCKLIT